MRMIDIGHSALLAAMILLPVPARAQAQAPAQAQAEPQTAPTLVRFTIETQARLRPDRATINAGVVANAPTAGKALAQSGAAIDKVLAALKHAKVDPRDIQTSTINLSPQLTYREDGITSVTGYQAANTLEITVQDIANLGNLIDVVVTSGANQLNGISFSAKDPTEAVNRAREEAVAQANQRAELYAKALGRKLVRITMLEEGQGNVFPISAQSARLTRSSKIETQIEPGELAYTVSITATFELR